MDDFLVEGCNRTPNHSQTFMRQGDNNTVSWKTAGSWKMSHLKPKIGPQPGEVGLGFLVLGPVGQQQEPLLERHRSENRYDVGMDQNLSVSTFGGMMLHKSQLLGLKSAIS